MIGDIEFIKISVVIPLFNKAENIERTLNSILLQTYPPHQIIVVDDGSTDSGADLVSSYEKRGVKLIRQRNQGVSAARNTGIQFATSDYVALLDADDYWKPNHLQVLSELINLYPQAGLLSTAYDIYRAGDIYRPKSVFTDGWSGLLECFLSSYRQDLTLVCSTTACVRKELCIEVGGFPLGVKRGEDIILWLKLALKAPVAHASIVTATYNRDGANRSDVLQDGEPSGALRFISELILSGDLNASQSKSVGILFDKIAILTAAGCRLSGNRAGALSIVRLSSMINRWRATFISLVISFIPLVVLKFAQDARHRRLN